MLPIVVANWKMQLDDVAAVALARAVATAPPDHARLILCPSFTALRGVADSIRGTPIQLGAQDGGPEARAAYTGEVSSADLAAIGCTYVLVGHSERRQLGEDDVLIRRKLHAALAAGLAPILCVGETLDERTSGQREAVLRRQVHHALEGCTLTGRQTLLLAYEPVWAIGTGHAATPDNAAQAHVELRDFLGELPGWGSRRSDVAILYGGSVDAENVRSFLAQETIQGVLVGSASQQTTRLNALLRAIV